MGKLRLMAIWEDKGIIAYINTFGAVDYFSQKGIHSELTEMEREIALKQGVISATALKCPEIPSNVTLYHEEPSIQGRVAVRFPVQSFRKSLRRLGY